MEEKMGMWLIEEGGLGGGRGNLMVMMPGLDVVEKVSCW